jgi:hypothetical protein
LLCRTSRLKYNFLNVQELRRSEIYQPRPSECNERRPGESAKGKQSSKSEINNIDCNSSKMQHPSNNYPDTIAAQATAVGRAGIGIIRVSGPKTKMIAEKLLHKKLKVQAASFCDYFTKDKKIIDKGIAIFLSDRNLLLAKMCLNCMLMVVR